jgi:hypothetical protein
MLLLVVCTGVLLLFILVTVYANGHPIVCCMALVVVVALIYICMLSIYASLAYCCLQFLYMQVPVVLVYVAVQLLLMLMSML